MPSPGSSSSSDQSTQHERLKGSMTMNSKPFVLLATIVKRHREPIQGRH